MKTDLSLLKGELAGCEASQWRVLGRHRRGRVCRLALVPQLGPGGTAARGARQLALNSWRQFCSKLSLVRLLPVNCVPQHHRGQISGAFQKADFKQIPPAWLLCHALICSGQSSLHLSCSLHQLRLEFVEFPLCGQSLITL